MAGWPNANFMVITCAHDAATRVPSQDKHRNVEYITEKSPINAMQEQGSPAARNLRLSLAE